MRKMLLKSLMVVAAMLVCLSASAIDKVVKSTGLDNEVTSLEELKSQKVILQNADGKMLYIPGVGGESSWDFKMTDLVNGLSSNNGAFLSAIDYDGHLIFQVFNLNGDERATPSWAGGKAYLNTQPAGVNDVIFGLAGMNDQHGQDGPNLAVWDVEYVEGQGFSFHNLGRDIYLGYDATNARPSTSVVYWKAFTAYHAGYVQAEVEAAYEQAIAAARTTETIAALEAAKSAFDSSADLNAFGDAVNAAIDVVNACQAINAKYANLDLDEAGAAVAADVLANYENMEYANIAELRAAYILAVKAQTTAGANMTGAIVNPEINGADGWTIEKPFGGNGPLLGETSFEYWAGNASDRSKASFDYYQVITGLPYGAYTVTADMYNSLNGETKATWNATSGVYGKGANESVTLVNEDGVTLKPYTTGQVFVVDGTIRIGVKNTVTPMAARWFVADNFKLNYLGETPEYAAATKPYAIAIDEGIENGTVAADHETAIAGATVTLTATPAEGYKLSTFYVRSGETPIDVTTAGTFVMPAGNVTISAVFEKAIPTLTATLVHTASSKRGDSADIINTVDADKEHVNNTNFGKTWAAAAYAEFSLAGLPKDATITKATLSFTGIGSGKNRTTDVMYVNAGESIDYENMPTSTTAVNLNATLIETVTFPANSTIAFETDVTKALTELTFNQKEYVIFKWTNNAGGGDIAGKNSENAPQLVVEYMPGAPEIANASFEANGQQTASDGPLTLTGWTFDGVGSQYNNTQILPAGAESKSAFGTSAPSEGEYSLFFRQGWNGTGNTITITSDALTAIPAGDYTLSVDYKQQYAYQNTQNSNTKVGIALVNGETTIGSEISPAAEAGGSATYFNETQWSTLTASFTVDNAISAGAKVVITLYSAGQIRSDFFIDNVQFSKIPTLQKALMNLEKAIAAAEAEAAKYHVGDKIFMYPAAQIEPLTTAIATAKAAYEAMESKETLDAATTALNDVLTAFAPTMTKPEAGKMYTIALNVDDATLPVLNIAANKISVETIATPIEFVEQADGTFALSNGSEYIVYKGGDTWSLSGTSTAYGWTIAAIGDGVYTIKGKNGYLGTDNTPAGSTCYGNKSVTGNVKWTISDCIPGTSVSATYHWGTFISQVDRTLPEGLEAYTCTGTTKDDMLQLEQAESIEANTAYILKNTTETDIELPTVAAVSKAEEESYDTGLLTGTYVQTNVPAGSYILQSQNGKTGFYLCDTADRIVGKNRCYMTLPIGVAKARSFIFGEDGATGVPTLKAETLDKLSNGKIYDVNGREIKSLQKGINIIDGTKVNVR